MITRGLNKVTKALGDPVPFLTERMRVSKDVRVLEIGCGLGNALYDLSEIFPDIRFFGFNKRAFPCQRLSTQISYVYGDAGCHLPFEDNSIDFAFSIHAIQFIADKIGLIKEVYRVLKKNGEFWFRLSDSLHEINGTPLCSVTDGVETFSLKDFFNSLQIPEIRYRMVSHKREGFTIISPSATILRKGNRELSLPVMEEYTTTDLSLEFPGKEGYLASHYTIQSSVKLHKMKKVLIVAASPHGYGHLYRGELISRYLSKNGFEVTYLSNNDVPLTYSSEEQFSTYFVNLSQGVEGENARKLFLEHIVEKCFDIVLIDHFPLGKLFFLESFKILHEKLRHHTKFICVFRDIFSIDDFRQRAESVSVLNQFFDRLLVFSDQKIMPLPDFLTLDIKIPVDYLGYLDPAGGKPQITVFGGGGKFNITFYQQTLEVIHQLGLDHLFDVKLFTGRNLPAEQRASLKESFPSVTISEHSEDLMGEISKSCITISTFGYNTFVQLLHYNNYNIIVPLPRNFQEQHTRADFFTQYKKKAFVIILDLKYKEFLQRHLSDITPSLINLEGLPNLIKIIRAI